MVLFEEKIHRTFWIEPFRGNMQKNLCWNVALHSTYVVDTYHMLNLHSKTRQRLLGYYFTNPTARHHLRDLAQRLDVDPSNLSKELRHLENEGLFTSETSGRQKYFSINRQYPLFAEVRRIVEKTIGTTPLLAESLQRIDGKPEAYLYGSFARNQQDAAGYNDKRNGHPASIRPDCTDDARGRNCGHQSGMHNRSAILWHDEHCV
jgi:hypothetical protein